MDGRQEIRHIIDCWLANTAINLMQFTEDPSELTDLPLGLLRIIRDKYSLAGSDGHALISRLIQEKEAAHAARLTKPHAETGAGPASGQD